MEFLKTIEKSNLTDQELIALYKKSHDLKILAELFQRYMELVYGVCLKYFKEPEKSKDAVMSIFEELIGKLKSHDVENFKSWLHTVARNYCLMQLRTPKNLKTTEINVEIMQSEEEVHLNGVLEREEQFDKLSKCLDALSKEQKLSVELFYLKNKCYNEIVEMTGFEWNQVRSHIQNGRRNLKQCMESNVEG
ncbi:MAG: RNA polymerase subunit sigma-70 [Bacteroidetes bacterium]|nr:MAG: RNA polymerase subunit sigma-70 [Bacteroidota bacterium]